MESLPMKLKATQSVNPTLQFSQNATDSTLKPAAKTRNNFMIGPLEKMDSTPHFDNEQSFESCEVPTR